MRILVVEDEPELLSAVAQSLREEGYAVDEAVDGVSGLFKAQSWEYDAIVLDLMLPGLNGWELLERLRKTRRIPVLILSARDTVEDRVDGLDLGADDYLVKPFELAELHARLRSLIRRAANQPTARITVAGAEVDLKARTLKFAGRPVELTAREFAIVELLALRRGEVVTRTQIYDLVGNAIAFNNEGGRVEVRLFSDEEDAVLTVRDNGIGIPARDCPKIFQRFFRVDKSRTRAVGGTGLGLAICKTFVEAHRGTIAVEDQPTGCVFRVSLPCSADLG